MEVPRPHAAAPEFLLVNKPKGMTSHDVVDAVRRARGVRRVGHGGTLDPLATGLLIIGVGGATKNLRDVLTLPKTYEATVTLGATSTTDDAEGVVRRTENGGRGKRPSRERVTRILARYHGEIMQTPPAYAAIKIGGRRAYERARKGEEVRLAPRRVTIHRLELLGYDYPTLRIRAEVSAGTYIRALARDIGAALGTGGYLTELTRTRIGPYRLENSVLLRELDERNRPRP